ncbi:hypothetical protein ABH908_000337 [Pseudomonas frederiksbergensis]|uniref:hypothetical protein n=1 Tax=Pseudomonas TaxID=286 RepID=UPI003D231072
MKKTMIALALMSIAATASATDEILVQVEMYRGTERLHLVADVVESGETADMQDKHLYGYGERPSLNELRLGAMKSPKAEEKSLVLGLEAHVTPRLQPDGRILVDTDVKYTGLKDAKHDGGDSAQGKAPSTQIQVAAFQQVVGSGTRTTYTGFDETDREKRVVITAIKMM